MDLETRKLLAAHAACELAIYLVKQGLIGDVLGIVPVTCEGFAEFDE